ncbi:MAG: hypothetical protein LBV21_01195 [Candidatus Adiutrix sp.]|jgi:hypothetical protein|nr:hypothetical protein [Candidatus Adiutrix sp.]
MHKFLHIFLLILIKAPSITLAGEDPNGVILKYIPYGQELNFFAECSPGREAADSCEQLYQDGAWSAGEYILNKAKNEYAAKYGYLTTPVIKADEIEAYKEKFRQGDFNAFLELRRKYENPDEPDYDPEQVETRQLLLAAVKQGSKEAMLDLGYEEPYIAETVLPAEDKPISVYAVCRGIEKKGTSAFPNCFLYILKIGATEVVTTDRQDRHYGQFRAPYLIPDERFTDPTSFRPQHLALVKSNEETLVALFHFRAPLRLKFAKIISLLKANIWAATPLNSTLGFFIILNQRL